MGSTTCGEISKAFGLPARYLIKWIVVRASRCLSQENWAPDKQHGPRAGTGTAGNLTQGSLARLPLHILDLTVFPRQSPLQVFGQYGGKGHPSSRSILGTGGETPGSSFGPRLGDAGFQHCRLETKKVLWASRGAMLPAVLGMSPGDTQPWGCWAPARSSWAPQRLQPALLPPPPSAATGHLSPTLNPPSHPMPFPQHWLEISKGSCASKTFALVTELGTMDGLNVDGLNVFKQLQNTNLQHTLNPITLHNKET